ncbi:hypothetical protein ACFV7Q_34915 [Streptomyces sp. NPDC059851]|uniref:hypothetical protein n=1 Tax=Streptomyces sp. NPDC059851 TaxID=3346971 RepID=UPI003647BDC6
MPGGAAALRTAVPDLPDDPSDAQLAAWMESAELIADDDFRTRLAPAAPVPLDQPLGHRRARGRRGSGARYSLSLRGGIRWPR